ncbi:MAG TPA: GC-type dockerin domain-anchored protein [Phycisphaerales bacterium]|nr:GC-type dockerin domain-anchored protein [Phycisphaerales bacterium]
MSTTVGSASITAVAVLPSGDVVAGGSFDTAGGVPSNSIAQFHPSTGAWSALASGTNSIVAALAVLPGGDVVAGGLFTSAGGASASRIARFNPTTSEWTALGSGVTGGTTIVVSALAVLPDGDLIVGGQFLMAGGVPANNVARYSPSTGTWSGLGLGVTNMSGPAGYVLSLAVLPGGEVLVGGSFSTAGGASASRIARYSPASNSWSSLGSGSNSFVSALAVLPSGEVLAGGTFTLAGGVPASGVACFNPLTNAWSALGAGTSGNVNGLIVLPGGDVIVGGSFATAGGVGANNISQYTFGSACPADFDCSGHLVVADIFAFLNAWFGGDLRADFDANPGLQVSDIFAFLNAWFAGC